MVKLGYHCSLEQFSSKELIDFAIKAEKAGFKHLSCSDHFSPWSNSQGHSANAWCWMAAALTATKMSCGVVCAPGYRYNPALVAQMAATLGEMFSERFWLALGSGEHLNEHFAIKSWPVKDTRNALLLQSYQIIKALLTGKTISSSSDYFSVNEAKLYTLPEKKIPIYGAALTPKTAGILKCFDGLITVGPFDKVKEVVEEYQKHSRKEKLLLKMDISYASSKEEAIDLGWQQWRYTQIDHSLLAELKTPEEFEEAAKSVSKEEFAEKILIINSPEDLQEAINKYSQLGFEQINLHNVNKQQQEFITAAAKLFK